MHRFRWQYWYKHHRKIKLTVTRPAKILLSFISSSCWLGLVIWGQGLVLGHLLGAVKGVQKMHHLQKSSARNQTSNLISVTQLHITVNELPLIDTLDELWIIWVGREDPDCVLTLLLQNNMNKTMVFSL